MRPELALYLVQQLKTCEQQAISETSITADELMERAGIAAFATLRKYYPQVHCIAVFCGSGNNAGDAYVLARLAHEAGLCVVVYSYKSIESLPVTAQHAAILAIAAGLQFAACDDVLDSAVELIVDGLLGIGLHEPVRAPLAQAIHVINDAQLPVVSLDVPSGLDADTGRVMGVCVHAAVTITFIARKVGMFTLDGPDYSGEIVCHSLGLETILATITPAACILDRTLFTRLLAPRVKNSHKGMYGHVLIIGGGLGMPGAGLLAALAAMRIGAGMVTLATRIEYARGVLPCLPEVMIAGVTSAEDLKPLLARSSVCVIGPGLGEDAWARMLFAAVMAVQKPLVVDASALHLLAESPQYDDNWVLTPHPGEAAHLLACSIADVQGDRRKSAQLIQQKYGGNVILKGVGSIIHTEGSQVYVCGNGDPGMATAGMGDILSGVIAGLMAQGILIADAASLGVWLHATAAEDAIAAEGAYGLIASDIVPYIRRKMNMLYDS